MKTRAAFATFTAATLAGCHSAPPTNDAVRRSGPPVIAYGGLVLTYDPDIDRVTSIIPPEGTNLLHTANLDQEPSPTGDYTFYGGAYTWTAPQAGAWGWRDAAGGEKAWPPDPAMDIGPATIRSRTQTHVTVTNPPALNGLVQFKRFAIIDRETIHVTFALKNTSDHPVAAGAWVNTAVAPDSVIAVRRGAGTPIRGWDDTAIERFNSISTPPGPHGWSLVRIPAANWEGGGKIWLDTKPEIAIWRDGWWLLRRQPSIDTENRLKAMGEGAVAVYIQPDAGIVEAELYAPITDIEPGATRTDVEIWHLIRDPAGTVDALPK
ncbi:MAG: DUF4380 domain-containing protein [Phycisphaerales bacterium]|nr:DUF4380 domain-containing protein [Phycisphaerales bacterium]